MQLWGLEQASDAAETMKEWSVFQRGVDADCKRRWTPLVGERWLHDLEGVTV